MSSNDFFITLSSNGSLANFPKNTVSHFWNQLSTPLELSNASEWEVGLTEVSMPPMANHLDLNRQDLTVYLCLEKRNEPYGYVGELSANFVMRPFCDASSFADSFMSALRESSVPGIFKNGIRVSTPFGRNIVKFRVVEDVFVMFSPKVWKVLGVAVGPEFVHRREEIGFFRKTAKVLGFVDIKAGHHSVWMYSNCCSHRLVAGSRVPLLRTVVIRSENDDVVHQVFTHPYYIPVSQSFFSSIEIFFTDNTGQQMKYFPGEALVTLHFRRRGSDKVGESGLSGKG